MDNPINTESGWIEWKGGECPIFAETRVLVRFRSGYSETEADLTSPADFWDWHHYDSKGDIIAYRVVGEAK